MRRRTIRMACCAIAATIALAGCGSSGGDDKASSGDADTTTTAAPDTGGTAVARAKDDASLGSILGDADGNTLYTLTKDGKAVDCTDACLGAWPPATVKGDPAAVEGTELGTADGPDGSTILTADGLPLYRFAGDASAADAKGEGIESFGGTWHVVKLDASGAGGDDTTTTTTADDGGGGDY